MMFVSGIKASLTSSRCAVRLVIALKTVLLMVSDVVAISLGKWLASVPPANRLLLPLLLIPFLLFPHATDSVSASGANPSMSADEEKNDPDFLDISTSESCSCSGDNECSVLFPLLSWFPQFHEACCVGFTSSVFSCGSSSLLPSSPSIRQDNELDKLQSQSDFPSPARSLRRIDR